MSEINYSKICNQILEVDKDIRFVGIISEKGELASYEYSSKITPLLSKKETESSVLEAFRRFKSRKKFQQKIGPPIYTITNYGDIKRATLFIKNLGLLLLSFDKNKDEYLLLNKIFFHLQGQNLNFDLKKFDSLNQLIEKRVLEEKLAITGELSARLAHDLRNPLSIIQIALENMKMMYGVNEKQQGQFDKVQRAIFRITHQVDDVLDFVKKHPPELNKTKFSEIIADALDELYIPNEILIKLPKNDVELNCDIKKLPIVFVNLILNGIQDIDGTGTIVIRLKENKKSIAIEVEDSGNGISKKDITRIFDPLFTTKQRGTGLGLASVKSIIASHGGKISVTSPPTIFKIILPKNF